MSEKTLSMPLRATSEELQAGLSPERQAELKKLARRLKAAYKAAFKDDSEPFVDRAGRAVAAEAEEYSRSVATYRRAFSSLAKAAGWASYAPEDYLIGRETTRGRPVREDALTERAAMRLSKEGKEAFDRAFARFQELSGGNMDAFLTAASNHYLKHGRF